MIVKYLAFRMTAIGLLMLEDLDRSQITFVFLLHRTQRTKNNWRNYEGSTTSRWLNQFENRTVRASDTQVIYTIHLPSFTKKGTYFDASKYAALLSHLGVSIVHLLPLEASRCDSSSTIDLSCWYHSRVIYPGIPHPDLGSVSDLHAFLAKLMQFQISAVAELDLAHFTHDSDWYNYDGSATSQSFGALFGVSPVYSYRDETCSKPDFRTGAASQLVLSSILNRYVSTFGLHGFWMKGMLCLRLDGASCEQGVGADNDHVISFLREMANRGWTLLGEDGNGFVQAATSRIKDITAPISQGGLGFTAQSNLAKGELLVSIVLQKPIPGLELVRFIEGFADFSARHVLALNTPETIHVSTVSTIESSSSPPLRLPSRSRLSPDLHGFLRFHFLSEVGSFNEASMTWESRGPRFGVFNYTRTLLSYRVSRALVPPYAPSLYFNANDTVFALLLNKKMERAVIVMNTAARPTNASVEIDFPPSFSGKWTPVIKSDGAEIFGGNPSKGDEVVVGKCLNQMAHKYMQCANVTLGAFAFRIYESY
ncbi:uncharacterized protein [Blastocystis hominis]|uniref:Glycosyl hydrolase family 13 catalytic domain-containing protein n=1 Tax=Blastocystis hominis TaxID=12968 RepID=D8M467_BLAHO|nr:uncharacterized protein [Blastocystis hominis]CBK22856.2 unnamed protein product [Blastocystis hominis]|eukprot:XP_012896904.1 uncharacterized protein [Blastocystis hominis]